MRLIGRLGTLAAVIAILGLGVAVSASTAARPQWSRPSKVIGVHLLRGVSCASRSFCMAVGGGQAVAYSSGHWARPQTIDSHTDINNGLVTVSCVTASFCAAGDGAGNAFVYNGTSWSSPALVTAAGLSQLSCGTTTFCGAVDVNGDGLFYNGSNWSTPQAIPGSSQALEISCPTGRFCMAMDGNGTGAYRLAAGSWMAAGQIRTSQPSGGSEPDVASAVSCSGPHFCAALDDFGEAFAWSGTGWSRPHGFDSNLLAGSDAVSCPSKTACTAVDDNGFATRWTGHRWSRKRRIDRGRAGLSDVSCATGRFCVAVDVRGHALVFR